MSATAKKTSPEERNQVMQQIIDLKEREKITYIAACEKMGIKPATFHEWKYRMRAKSRPKRRAKISGRRRRPQPVLVTSVVPADSARERPSTADFRGPDTIQLAEMLAHMNGRALRAFFEGKTT